MRQVHMKHILRMAQEPISPLPRVPGVTRDDGGQSRGVEFIQHTLGGVIWRVWSVK